MRLAGAVSLWLVGAMCVHADTALWNGDGGQLPDEVLPFSLVNTASPETPELVGGELVLTTSSQGENMYYVVAGADITPQPATEIRFGMRLGPGTSKADYRGHATVFFTPGAPAIGNALHMKDGMMFLMDGPLVRGSTALVDTTSVAHDYVVRVIGSDAGSAIAVYQDGNLTLTGTLFNSTSHNSSDLRIGFGEISIYTQGTSYWSYFEHNAVPQICPSPCDGEMAFVRRPTFSWCPATDATWYEILIMREGKLFVRRWVQGTTEWQPDFDLHAGDYCWWVRPWGPVTGMGGWSTGCCFSVEGCDVAAVTGLAPDGACLAGAPLELTWQADACATHHQVLVARDGKTWFKKWVATGQTVGDVTLPLLEAPPFGGYRWWVRGWNVDGLGPWSAPAAFEVGRPLPQAPSGPAENPVTFSWDDSCSERATWYQVWVRFHGHDVARPWVRRSDTTDCGGGLRCFGPGTLPAGDYTYWMRAWAPGGMSSWSDEMSFTVAGP